MIKLTYNQFGDVPTCITYKIGFYEDKNYIIEEVSCNRRSISYYSFFFFYPSNQSLRPIPKKLHFLITGGKKYKKLMTLL